MHTMFDAHIARLSYRPRLGAFLALAFLVVGAARADAQAFQTYPGSNCQASGSAQDLYYSANTVANRNNATSSAVCPIARTNPTDPWLLIRVFVRDRHSTANITCVAEARSLTGTLIWTQSRSTVAEGEQTLVFNAPGVDPADFGPYVVICSIPPIEEVNQPSYISSYLIAEP
jgi:hypothetical protein